MEKKYIMCNIESTINSDNINKCKRCDIELGFTNLDKYCCRTYCIEEKKHKCIICNFDMGIFNNWQYCCETYCIEEKTIQNKKSNPNNYYLNYILNKSILVDNYEYKSIAKKRKL